MKVHWGVRDRDIQGSQGAEGFDVGRDNGQVETDWQGETQEGTKAGNAGSWRVLEVGLLIVKPQCHPGGEAGVGTLVEGKNSDKPEDDIPAQRRACTAPQQGKLRPATDGRPRFRPCAATRESHGNKNFLKRVQAEKSLERVSQQDRNHYHL